MFIQTEFTPNPDAIKFCPGTIFNDKGSYYFIASDAAASSPLALQLFAIKGVEAVFLGSDFITVTKASTSDWEILKPEVIMVIMDYLNSGKEVVIDSTANSIDLSTLSSIERQIIELIDTRVKPSVAMDGGDIVYKSFDSQNGIVFLELHGACSGCPSSSLTLKKGIESMLQYYVPEVKEVRAFNAEGEESDLAFEE